MTDHARRFCTLLISIALATVFVFSQATEEKSVKPGINDTWKNPDLAPLVDILESESREIYTQRADLAALVGPVKGATVADIGAGSGFMAEEFARLIGAEGKVYAVDINPKMLERLSRSAKSKGIHNIETVVGTDTSIELPDRSVDLLFICDTYHHFEYPKTILESIRRALKPGGQLVLVDFDRVPGTSPAWLLQHVRAGRDVFAGEIIQAGFELTNDHNPGFLKENYVLRFRKAKR